MKTVTYSMQPSVIKMLEKLVAEDRKTGDTQSRSGKISDLIKLEFKKVFGDD